MRTLLIILWVSLSIFTNQIYTQEHKDGQISKTEQGPNNHVLLGNTESVLHNDLLLRIGSWLGKNQAGSSNAPPRPTSPRKGRKNPPPPPLSQIVAKKNAIKAYQAEQEKLRKQEAERIKQAKLLEEQKKRMGKLTLDQQRRNQQFKQNMNTLYYQGLNYEGPFAKNRGISSNKRSVPNKGRGIFNRRGYF